MQFCSGVVPSLFREGFLCLITNGILNMTLDGVVFIDQNLYVVWVDVSSQLPGSARTRQKIPGIGILGYM